MKRENPLRFSNVRLSFMYLHHRVAGRDILKTLLRFYFVYMITFLTFLMGKRLSIDILPD